MTSRSRVLVVVPTYREADNIGTFLTELWKVLPPSSGVLVVDDASPDGTADRVRVLQKTYTSLFLLERSGKWGLGTAYQAGFAWGLDRGYDILLQMDADFSHHPRYVNVLLEALSQHDFVIGSRAVPGGGTLHWGKLRKILSAFGSAYARFILGVPIGDFTGGLNGWRRSVLEAISQGSLRSDGYSFQIELKYRAARAGFRWTEVPIVFEDRKIGSSKMSGRIILEALYRVWELRFRSGK